MLSPFWARVYMELVRNLSFLKLLSRTIGPLHLSNNFFFALIYFCPFCSYPYSAKPTASLKQQKTWQTLADREGAFGQTWVRHSVVPLWICNLKINQARTLCSVNIFFFV